MTFCFLSYKNESKIRYTLIKLLDCQNPSLQGRSIKFEKSCISKVQSRLQLNVLHCMTQNVFNKESKFKPLNHLFRFLGNIVY